MACADIQIDPLDTVEFVALLLDNYAAHGDVRALLNIAAVLNAIFLVEKLPRVAVYAGGRYDANKYNSYFCEVFALLANFDEVSDTVDGCFACARLTNSRCCPLLFKWALVLVQEFEKSNK